MRRRPNLNLETERAYLILQERGILVLQDLMEDGKISIEAYRGAVRESSIPEGWFPRLLRLFSWKSGG